MCGFGLNIQYQFQSQNQRSLEGELSLWCLAILSCPVLWRKRGQWFRLNGLIKFILYSHQFLLVRQAPQVPEEKGRKSEKKRYGDRVIHPADRCVYLFKKNWPDKCFSADFKMTELALEVFILTGLKKMVILWKTITPLTANQNPSVTQPTSTPTQLCVRLSFCNNM